jgi:hypothetical protein
MGPCVTKHGHWLVTALVGMSPSVQSSDFCLVRSLYLINLYPAQGMLPWHKVTDKDTGGRTSS